MAKYSDIKGFTVQTVSSDPGATQFAAGSWASDAPAPQTTQAGGSFGTSTAAVSSGGYDGTAYVQTTIEYNGSSWSSGGSMNRPAGQSFPGFGTEPSGGIAGGYKTSGNAVVNNFESYNGTAFTESTDLNSARQSAGATGASATAGIVVGGTTGVLSPPDTTGNNNVEIWNGSSWTEISEINTARYNLKALGSTCPAPTAVVTGGENSGTKTGATEKYNGSAWTETGDMNTARSGHGGAGNVATSGICFGGEGSAPGFTNYALTEHFDGSTWTEVSDLVGTRYQFSTATGTGASAIAGQGRNPGFTGLTEIWSAPSTFQKTIEGQLYFNSTTNTFKETITDIPAGTWSAGGVLNTARQDFGGLGSQTAAFAIGGFVSPAGTTNVEQYNGTSFTETTDLNAAITANACAGTTTAGITFGGAQPPGTVKGTTELWNGSAWTEVNDLNTARGTLAGGGTSTAALAATGNTNTASVTNTESWDGTSWTEVNDVNLARAALAGFGTQSNFLIAGGDPTPKAQTELWDGSSWTEVNDLNTARGQLKGSGIYTSGIVFAGYNAPTLYANTEFWNGSSWTEVNDMATARRKLGSANTSATAALAFGGGTPSSTTATEEWTVPLANKTITAS